MTLDLDKLFIRVNTHPESDLARGYSYSMGCFGDESEAHEGLSGYSFRSYGVIDVVARLDERMGISGDFGGPMFVTVYEGRDVGMGPDGEDLFRPSRIIASFRTSEIKSRLHLLDALAKLGIVDEDWAELRPEYREIPESELPTPIFHKIEGWQPRSHL